MAKALKIKQPSVHQNRAPDRPLPLHAAPLLSRQQAAQLELRVRTPRRKASCTHRPRRVERKRGGIGHRIEPMPRTALGISANTGFAPARTRTPVTRTRRPIPGTRTPPIAGTSILTNFGILRGHDTSVDAPTDASAKFGYGHGIGCCLLSGLLMQHLTAGQYGSARDGSKSN